MHGHEGCGCGHGHGAEQEMAPVSQATAHDGHDHDLQEEAMGGCGDGCGCAGGQGDAMSQLEAATIQGFLTGLYASTLPREKLVEYFAAMGSEVGSVFARPAQFLSSALETVAPDAPGDKPIAVRLLETVSGEALDSA